MIAGVMTEYGANSVIKTATMRRHRRCQDLGEPTRKIGVSDADVAEGYFRTRAASSRAKEYCQTLQQAQPHRAGATPGVNYGIRLTNQTEITRLGGCRVASSLISSGGFRRPAWQAGAAAATRPSLLLSRAAQA